MFEWAQTFSATHCLKDWLLTFFFYSDGFFFAVKEVSLMDQGLNAKQRILQLEHVSNGLFMLENDARYFASNDMFLN